MRLKRRADGYITPLEEDEMSEGGALGEPMMLPLARGAAQHTRPDQKSASGALAAPPSPAVVAEGCQGSLT